MNQASNQTQKIVIDLRDPAKFEAFLNTFRRHTPEHEALMNGTLRDFTQDDNWLPSNLDIADYL